MKSLDIVAVTLGKISSLTSPDEHKVVFYSQGGVLSNLLYLYLALRSHEGLNLIWIEKNRSLVDSLQKRGVNAIFPKSRLREVRIVSSSKYLVSSNGLPIYKSSKQVGIELWHGIPLKKIGRYQRGADLWQLRKRVKLTDTFVSSSEFVSLLLSAVFDTNLSKFKIFGYPSGDRIINMKKDESRNLLARVIRGRFEPSSDDVRVVFYLPTFRDYSNHNVISLLSSKTLLKFLNSENVLLMAKLHPRDESLITTSVDRPNIFLLNTSHLLSTSLITIYDLLPAVDVLITDYSSVYFDYLLLNRPIVFYVPDLEDYRKTRGFLLEPYERWTPGDKARNISELIWALDEALNNPDKWKREREWLRDVMFKYQDGKSSERIIKYFWDR